MATKCFCDRCGKLVDGSFGVEVVKIKKRPEAYSPNWNEYGTYDLCVSCLNQVERFIREK